MKMDEWDDNDDDNISELEQLRQYKKRLQQLEAKLTEYQNPTISNNNSSASTPRAGIGGMRKPPPKVGSPARKPPPKGKSNRTKTDNHTKSQTYTKLGGNIV